MGYFVLNGRVRKWVEGDEPDASIDNQCQRIYDAIKKELNILISEGYEAEFIKYNLAWILTLSRENEKIISFVFQFMNEQLIVYIYTMETKLFIYKDGFIKNSIEIVTK